jgi:hypothetical protein
VQQILVAGNLTTETRRHGEVLSEIPKPEPAEGEGSSIFMRICRAGILQAIGIALPLCGIGIAQVAPQCLCASVVDFFGNCTTTQILV